MSDTTVNVGDRVRDPISGLEGEVQARTEWKYGCVRIIFQPDGNKDGKPFDLVTIDEPQAEVLEVTDKPPAAPRYGPRDDAAAQQRPQ